MSTCRDSLHDPYSVSQGCPLSDPDGRIKISGSRSPCEQRGRTWADIICLRAETLGGSGCRGGKAVTHLQEVSGTSACVPCSEKTLRVKGRARNPAWTRELFWRCQPQLHLEMPARRNGTATAAVVLALFLWVRLSEQAPVNGSSWSYYGPDGEKAWSKDYPLCGGRFQSPIDFRDDILRYDSSLLPIELEGYNTSSLEQFTLTNNGHSVKMTLSPTMRIRNLPNRYCAAQLHLHWGSQRKDEGSEHTVGGKRFAAELHIVHYNADQYRDMNSAADKSNGLAVLGILIQVGKFNPSYEKIFNHFRNVKYKGQNTPLSGFNIRKLLPDRLDEYYRYEGSLTTPPCYPSVVWTVFRDPVEISQKQLQALQTALYCTQSDDPDPIEMVDNFRRVQEFERMVSISFRQRGFVLPIVAASSLVAIAVLALALWLIRRTKSKRPKEDQGVIYKPAISKEEENVSTA